MTRLLAASLALALGGCVASPSAAVLHELAGDQNALCWIVTTPWGGSTLDRNHGCPGNAGNTAIIVPASMNMQVIKP